MGRRQAICGFALSALGFATVELACSSLKDTTTNTPFVEPDGQTVLPDGRVVATTDASHPIAVPDAGPPPADSVCGAHDEWTTTPKATPGCEQRQVMVVHDAGVIDINGISIAHNAAGRIAISFNNELPQGGEWHLVQLLPTAPDATPVELMKSTSDIIHDGYLSRVIGLAPDSFRALTFDVEDQDETGAVHAQTITGGATQVPDSELVLDGIASPSEIAYAIDGTNTEYAAIRFGTTDKNTAKLAALTRSSGAWTGLPDLYPALKPQDAPGIGAASLFIDTNAQLHVLFHQNSGAGASTPRYVFLAEDKWSAPKTIDGPAGGLVGYNPCLAMAGNRKYALFFHRPDGPTGTQAELLLATWEDESDDPKIEIVDSGISSNDPLHPTYRAAMAIDKYGLVHIAEIFPDTDSELTGKLRYLRQNPTGTDWLDDIVDPNVLSQFGTAEVDLVVDENARPHIAYVSGVDSKVRYATRYDR